MWLSPVPLWHHDSKRRPTESITTVVSILRVAVRLPPWRQLYCKWVVTVFSARCGQWVNVTARNSVELMSSSHLSGNANTHSFYISVLSWEVINVFSYLFIRLLDLLIYVVCLCQDVQNSIDFSERISGRTIFKCVEEPALMGACEQRKTESPLDHCTISIKQHPLNVEICIRYWLRHTLEVLLAAKVQVSTRWTELGRVCPLKCAFQFCEG